MTSAASTPRPAQSRGSRNLGSGSRTLHAPATDRGGTVRPVTTVVKGKAVTLELSVHAAFRDGLVLIAKEKTKHIRRGNVLVRNRELATRHRVDEAYIVYVGLRSAIRAYDVHANDGYVAEADLLEALTSKELPEAMVKTLSMAGATTAQKRDWSVYMGKIAEKLKGDHHKGKSEARAKMLRAADVHDALGRPNPSAARARTMAGLSRLRDRQEAIPGLNAHRAKIAAQLKVINFRTLAMVFDLEQEVKRAMKRVKEAGSGQQVDLASLAECLDNAGKQFASRDVNPYGPHAFKHYARDLGFIATALRGGRLTRALERLDVLARAILLQRERGAIDAALTAVSRIKHAKADFTASDRQIVTKIVETVHNFLTTHRHIDEGFRHKVGASLRAAIGHAMKAVEQGDVQAAYDALDSAARCI